VKKPRLAVLFRSVVFGGTFFLTKIRITKIIAVKKYAGKFHNLESTGSLKDKEPA